MSDEDVRGRLVMVKASFIRPNPWNPNRMSPEMLQKERASINEFGFIDPITTRIVSQEPDIHEIIDGEHRFRVGVEEGIGVFPCWTLGLVDEDVAKQLTIVLNETRGEADARKLEALVRDLSTRVDAPRLAEVLPFSAERMAELTGLRDRVQVEFEATRNRAKARVVERVYRLPLETAERLDDAIGKARVEGAKDEAEAIDHIARDYIEG